MKIYKLILILIICLSAFVLILINLQDASNIFPAWIMDYQIIWFILWLVIFFGSLSQLIK